MVNICKNTVHTKFSPWASWQHKTKEEDAVCDDWLLHGSRFQAHSVHCYEQST